MTMLTGIPHRNQANDEILGTEQSLLRSVSVSAMKIGFCLYDGMTVLDFVGVYDPLIRLEEHLDGNVEWAICGRTKIVRADGLTIATDRIEPDLGEFDMVVVPGGRATRDLRHDADMISWIATAAPCEYCVSVCTGSLLYGAAGLLDGKRATTHPSATHLLAEYATVVDDRVVHDGNVVTSGGVTAAIDLGLYLTEVVGNRAIRKAIAKQMDYPYDELTFTRSYEHSDNSC